MPRCCQSLEQTGSSASALSNPPPGIFSRDVSVAAVAAASARTAAILGAGPEQTAAAVEEAVHSFFRTLHKREPTQSRAVYFDLYRDDEEEEHGDEVTCVPVDSSAANDGTTNDGTTNDGTTQADMSPLRNASCGGSMAGGDRMLRTPLAATTSNHLTPHRGGSATQHSQRASATGKQFKSPWCEEYETPVKSTARVFWDEHSLLSGFGRPLPAPAWVAGNSGFHPESPPRALLQAAPLGLPSRPRSLLTPHRYGKLPRDKGVRASQLLDGALKSAFEM